MDTVSNGGGRTSSHAERGGGTVVPPVGGGGAKADGGGGGGKKDKSVVVHKPDLNLSRDSLDSQAQLEAAVQDLIQQTDTRRALFTGWLHGEPITNAGKKRQLTKMILLIMTPVLVLMGVTFYFMAENIYAREEAANMRKSVEISVELGELVDTLQRERDQSVMYLSSIGPETKSYLLQSYLETDSKIQSLSDWPTNLDKTKRDVFQNKRAFQQYLSTHRNEVGLLDQNLYDEIHFYTDCISVFTRWLYDTIGESKYGTTWRTLIAYQKLVGSKLAAGIERALGGAVLATGGFEDHEIYEWYNQQVNLFTYNYRTATNYTPFVEPIAFYWPESDMGHSLTSVIQNFRYEIQYGNISEPSLRKASIWFDTMTVKIDLLLEIQSDLAKQILRMLDERATNVTSGIIISAFLLVLVIAMCPILIRSVYDLTNDIQSYALVLAHKTKELNREKKRTDTLLYQMLPKPVAEQLKLKKDVNAEYYKEVSIFFSDIVGFTNFSQQCSPLQIVELLNEVYAMVDSRIDLYDVYKVETIGDMYMVASGLPSRNGSRHASEIANMALDLQSACRTLHIPYIPGGKIHLRMGIHSGPVVAGVVGTKLPRYCLFGDTVNVASRMESHGSADMIHISSSTFKILDRQGTFILHCRGPIEVKGKGRMVTYWLLGTCGGQGPRRDSNKDGGRPGGGGGGGGSGGGGGGTVAGGNSHDASGSKDSQLGNYKLWNLEAGGKLTTAGGKDETATSTKSSLGGGSSKASSDGGKAAATTVKKTNEESEHESIIERMKKEIVEGHHF